MGLGSVVVNVLLIIAILVLLWRKESDHFYSASAQLRRGLRPTG